MTAQIDIVRSKMDKTIESTQQNFANIRTGRANPNLLNGIVVSYYGAPTKLRQMAAISVPEPRTLTVAPYDASQAAAVEKAIRDSDLGVNPARDGNVIRITMPELTEERRKEYVRMAKQEAESGKVALRSIRRNAREDVEKSLKNDEITEDDRDDIYKQLDDLTKKYSAKIDSLFSAKQKEILEV